MIRLTVLLALAWPVCAQFRSIDISFQGVGCATCVESMPDRMKRIRGVESATVDSATGTLKLALAATNRVRLEQVRDAIEQDGTKVKSATVTIAGILKTEAGNWLLTPEGVAATYAVVAKDPEPGRVRLEGVVDDLYLPPPLKIQATRVEKLE